jgi:hypothetical protein
MANLAANGSAESISQFITCPNCEGTGKILASNLDGRVYDHVGSPPSDTPTSESASESTQHSRNQVKLMLREIPGIQDQSSSDGYNSFFSEKEGRITNKNVRKQRKTKKAKKKIKRRRSGR